MTLGESLCGKTRKEQRRDQSAPWLWKHHRLLKGQSAMARDAGERWS